jgi:trehalose-6-phosphatase
MKFKVGDKVAGVVEIYDQNGDRAIFTSYMGIITHDFEDGSYSVLDSELGDLLVELYSDDTMRLATPLDEVIK